MKDNSYRPIECNLYDYIEHYAVKQEPVKIVYMKDGTKVICFQKILDTYTNAQKEEHLILESKEMIRMDQLISIESIDFRVS